jgi:hypothetical protein
VAIVSFSEAGANTSVTIASDLVRPQDIFFFKFQNHYICWNLVLFHNQVTYMNAHAAQRDILELIQLQ